MYEVGLRISAEFWVKIHSLLWTSVLSFKGDKNSEYTLCQLWYLYNVVKFIEADEYIMMAVWDFFKKKESWYDISTFYMCRACY